MKLLQTRDVAGVMKSKARDVRNGMLWFFKNETAYTEEVSYWRK